MCRVLLYPASDNFSIFINRFKVDDMHNLLIDNSSDILSMETYLKQCISLEGMDRVRIATGYWDVLGMSMVLSELSAFLGRKGTLLQLLIGRDPYVYTSLLQNPKYKDATYPADYIRTDIDELELKPEYAQVIQLLAEHLQTGKIQVRIYQKNVDKEVEFLHSKCYIFSGEKRSLGIIGSSNFTKKGLSGNSELNYLETDPARVTARPQVGSTAKGHIYWFEEKWALSQEWSREFLEQIIKPSKLYPHAQPQPFTPYEQYIKLLQLQFGEVVDKALGDQLASYLPTSVKKLDYQLEAVKRCISIMREHGGFMLGDVVGLGKTIVGCLIIKHFLSVPQEEGRGSKVLIISLPAIQSSWKRTVEAFDREPGDKMSPYIDFITTGRIDTLYSEGEDDEYEMDGDDDTYDSGDFAGTLQEKDYGLIIIDESHKFRNKDTQMYKSLDELIGHIGTDTGVYPYVGLLSATPQNNGPRDLMNQIYLFERNRRESTLKKAEGGNLELFFSKINKEYDQLLKCNTDLSKEERHHRLDEVSRKLRDCILCDILERRTRTDIKRYYQDDIASQGIVFPEIMGPQSLEYVMDDELAQLFYETMTLLAPTQEDKDRTEEWLRYARYRAIEYFIDPAHGRKYAGRGNRDVSIVSKQLATIMQIQLVKRLESSFSAFTRSLQNLRRYTENMIRMWENDTIFVCPQIDVNKELDYEAKSQKRQGEPVTFEDCIEEIRAKIQKLTAQGKNSQGQNAEYSRADFKAEYYEELKRDRDLIARYCDRWARNSQDPKFDAFKESLVTKLFDPEKNTSGKLVIFSEAIDTVEALARAVKAKGHKPLVITSANRDEKEQVIMENFDANYDGEQKSDYDVIITTEVLAEGVNLHRANVILNYDTPWNSTRLMQRIGRVNRIGSREPKVYVYNFMPSAEGDAEIQLVHKAHTKLQSFHILFGEDSKIFSDEESIVHYDMVKAIDGEESPLQPYISKLKQYKADHPKRYAEIESAAGACWQIAQAAHGTAYFVVKAPYSARLVVKTDSATGAEAKIISPLEALEEMQVEPTTPSVPLPSSWDELSKSACRVYNQYFVRIRQSRAGALRTKAQGIIVKLQEHNGLSPASQSLLRRARMLVDKGSIDIIKRIIFIDEELEAKESRLFALEQHDIDHLLEEGVGKLVAKVESRQGEASIILGTIK